MRRQPDGLKGVSGNRVANSFESFLGEAESRLRHAFVARYGPENGRDVTAEALAYGWEHWDRVSQMDNPVGYLYRVGQSKGRQYRNGRPFFPAVPAAHEPEYEPGLGQAIASLSERQRVVVVMVHCYGWNLTEVAELLGVGLTTVQKHEERGMAKLRRSLEVVVDA